MKKTAIFVTAIVICGGLAFANQYQGMSLGFLAPTVNDKANVYSPATGEIVYDSSDSKFYGRTHGGTWVDMTSSATAEVPTGTVLPFAGTTAPTGYVIANGAAVSRTGSYAALFAVIGTTFGAGDGSTTFNLPDLRGIFIRGAGSQTIGSVTYTATHAAKQNDTTKKNGLSLSDPGHSHGISLYNTISNTNPGVMGGQATNYGSTSTQSATTGITLGSGDAETRPANISLTYIIKI